MKKQNVKKTKKVKAVKKLYKKILKVDSTDCYKNMNIKIKLSDLKIVRDFADKYTGGNVSNWLRYAMLKAKPSAKDFVKVEIKIKK